MRNDTTQLIEKLKSVLDAALFLSGRALQWNNQMSLLGNVPELDSMAIMNVLSALELNFNIMIEDDDINADIFATIETLAEFIHQKQKNQAISFA